MIKIILLFFVMVSLSGCLERIGQIDRNLRPYGAHWIKDGMTRERRMTDWLQCGGGEGLSDGFERQSNITTKEFFDGLDRHRKMIRSCMDSKGYKWIEQCDASCLHP
jgi:hypothetical protein